MKDLREETIKRVKIIILLLLILSVQVLKGNAGEINGEIGKRENSAKVQEIEISGVMEKALSHSKEVEIGEINRRITAAEVGIARSEYYPQIILSGGSEYTKGLGAAGPVVTSVGESFINTSTRYQSIMGITLSYNVYDFGVRRWKVGIAKADGAIRELESREQQQELRLRVLDTYTKILIIQKEKEKSVDIVGLLEGNVEILERMYKSGEVGLLDLKEGRIRLSKERRRVIELCRLQREHLRILSGYTGEEYDSEEIKVGEIGVTEGVLEGEPDYRKSILWQLYEKQIKKKELEIKLVRGRRYPRIVAYGRYYIYGMDQSSYGEMLGEMRPSNYTLGGSMVMPIFDGMRNRSEVRKAELERSRLEYECERAMREYVTRVETLRGNLRSIESQIAEEERILGEIESKEASRVRLEKVGEIGPMDLNESRIEEKEQEISLGKAQVTKAAIGKSIEILTEAE